jgi:hypothetical protein
MQYSIYSSLLNSAVIKYGKIKRPFRFSERPFKRIWQLPTLPHCGAVPSAIRGLTSLFGMGRGEHPWKNHHKSFAHLYCYLSGRLGGA